MDPSRALDDSTFDRSLVLGEIVLDKTTHTTLLDGLLSETCLGVVRSEASKILANDIRFV